MALKFYLEHVSLRVQIYEAARDWYQRVLGLEVVCEWADPNLPGLRLGHLRFGATKLELIGGGMPHARRVPQDAISHLAHAGVVHLCLLVPDLDDAVKHLRDLGEEPFEGPQDVPALDMRLVLLHDPDGNVIEVAERRPAPAAHAHPRAFPRSPK